NARSLSCDCQKVSCSSFTHPRRGDRVSNCDLRGSEIADRFGASPVETQSDCCSAAHVHAGAQGSNGSVSEGTISTCPMHPQIRQAGPGFCPICGMALEPELASAGAAPAPEL